jgi:hypothetical protein
MSKNNKVKTRWKFFTLSGITARLLIAISGVAPEPADVAIAVAFGIVEMLGVKRLFKILGPAIKAQIKQQLRGGNNVTRS